MSEQGEAKEVEPKFKAWAEDLVNTGQRIDEQKLTKLLQLGDVAASKMRYSS